MGAGGMEVPIVGTATWVQDGGPDGGDSHMDSRMGVQWWGQPCGFRWDGGPDVGDSHMDSKMGVRWWGQPHGCRMGVLMVGTAMWIAGWVS